MDVIRHAANADHWRTEPMRCFAKKGVHVTAESGVVQKWPAILRGKHDVQVDLCKRLRHGDTECGEA